MRELLFLEPVFQETIWGGSRMRDVFGYALPAENVGEAWVVGAHEKGDCRIRSGTYAGQSLGSLWRGHRELFGNLEGEVFPLLVKIIDAKGDLSIQVHPDDEYARAHENGALGKTECWYILDCDEDATIVIGHNAKSRRELRRMIDGERWADLIKIRRVKKGDFFQIEPGTVHAIRGGTMILETQQNSDVTYRLYDYGRLQSGKPRELHTKKSVDVIRCPHEEKPPVRETSSGDGCVKENLVSCPSYVVDKWEIRGEKEISQDHPFLIVDVIDGRGSADGIPIAKGDHMILPYRYGTCVMEGSLSLITSHVSV